MSDERSLPRQFEPVGKEEAAGLLRESARTFASAMLWTKDQTQLLNTHITLYSDVEKLFYVWVPKSYDPHLLMDDLAKHCERDCYFSISLSRANIFFRAGFAGADEGGIKFNFPEKIFKVQRRKDFRFMIPPGHVLRLEFEDPLTPTTKLSKKLLDISAGGAALLVDDAESPLFTPEAVIKNVIFILNGHKISCSAEVRYVKKRPPELCRHGCRNCWKIGVRFVNILPGDAQKIAAYVFEESRKFFSKFL
ncbi:MAG: hypothetical protein A2583_08300 [Bdellovibrionales bacterium RIFOXYD1_FULL_53_11]|nr:MAG: hypothetical protein A2583_08300 [Bdellovibrionales bacterium RIFOXYD1_FULL_53_11]